VITRPNGAPGASGVEPQTSHPGTGDRPREFR